MARVTSTEANRAFSKLLAKVRKGQVAEITVHGEVVARMIPAEKRDKAAEARKKKEWEAFLERLRRKPALNLPRVTRDEMYD